MHPVKKAIFLAALLAPAQAEAVVLRVDSTAGLMQQPTSHYYHVIYGGQVSLATASEHVVWNTSYFQRPTFKNLGYADKDYGWFTTIGTKLTKSKDSGVFAAIGGGSVGGWVKTDKNASGIAKSETRSFRLIGPTVTLDYEYRLGPVQWSVGHQTFVGFVDRSEVMAYVAWPYNFFTTTMGVTW